MKLVKLFMKSGNIIEYETDELVTTTDKLTRKLNGMQWIKHSEHIELQYLNVEEVEGITIENLETATNSNAINVKPNVNIAEIIDSITSELKASMNGLGI